MGEINCGLMAAARGAFTDRRPMKAMDSCFAFVGPHQHGIADNTKGGFLQTKHPSCQCVPSTAINSFGISNNYLFAFFTPVGQVLVVTFVAPWFAFYCYKRLSRQRFVAVVTTKMIMMPLLVHGFKNTFLGVDQL